MKQLTYYLQEGGFLQAGSPIGLAEALRRHFEGELPNGSLEEFMEKMGARCSAKNGMQIRTDTVPHFIFDLIDKGFIGLPVPLPTQDVLRYARLYMDVAVPEFLPSGWTVQCDINTTREEETGLDVRARGMLGMEVVQATGSYPIKTLLSPGTWRSKATMVAAKARDLF